MKRFADLYQSLDRSTATLDKRAALVAYFRDAPPRDAAWALFLLSGGKVSNARRKIAGTQELRDWAAQACDVPIWLLESSYHAVGDLAETLALLMPDPQSAPRPAGQSQLQSPPQLPPPFEPQSEPHSEPQSEPQSQHQSQRQSQSKSDAVSPTSDQPVERSLAEWIESVLLPVANQDAARRREVVVEAWRTLDFDQRLVFNKLLTGALRVGVSQRMVQQALAEMSGVAIALIAQRMLGAWTPRPEFMRDLLTAEALPGDRQQPYPFYLASPLESEVDTLGAIQDWIVEWKWDGIRAQLIRRHGETAVWSRGEERLDGRFPEVEQAAAKLDVDCVLDGELLAWMPDQADPMPFSSLQTRIQRLKPGPKWLAQAPVVMQAYDLLEYAGEDLRQLPQNERRARLDALLQRHPDPAIRMSPALELADWDAARALRASAREKGVEGFILKRADAVYQSGRRRGDWWKWKIDPLTIDAVLLYAQAGHGRRSTLYTDYTFGVWHEGALVPIAKAYSGLTDKEIETLDRWIRAHTLERFGPVRSVQPQHVFELGFEGVNVSKRHKAGVAVRFPRILRWRTDKPVDQADALETLQALAR